MIRKRIVSCTLVLFCLFLLVFLGADVLGAPVPDLSVAGTYTVPPQCAGDQFKFTIGKNAHVLAKGTRYSYNDYAPAYSYTESTNEVFGKVVSKNTVNVPAGRFMTKDHVSIQVNGPAFNYTLDGKSVGDNGGPFSYLLMANTIWKHTLNEVKAYIATVGTTGLLFPYSVVIDGVTITFTNEKEGDANSCSSGDAKSVLTLNSSGLPLVDISNGLEAVSLPLGVDHPVIINGKDAGVDGTKLFLRLDSLKIDVVGGETQISTMFVVNKDTFHTLVVTPADFKAGASKIFELPLNDGRKAGFLLTLNGITSLKTDLLKDQGYQYQTTATTYEKGKTYTLGKSSPSIKTELIGDYKKIYPYSSALIDVTGTITKTNICEKQKDGFVQDDTTSKGSTLCVKNQPVVCNAKTDGTIKNVNGLFDAWCFKKSNAYHWAECNADGMKEGLGNIIVSSTGTIAGDAFQYLCSGYSSGTSTFESWYVCGKTKPAVSDGIWYTAAEGSKVVAGNNCDGKEWSSSLKGAMGDLILACFNDKACDDGTYCTVDTCVAGKCVYSVSPNTCLIDLTCYNNKEQKIGDACQICDSTKNKNGWTQICIKPDLDGDNKVNKADVDQIKKDPQAFWNNVVKKDFNNLFTFIQQLQKKWK